MKNIWYWVCVYTHIVMPQVLPGQCLEYGNLFTFVISFFLFSDMFILLDLSSSVRVIGVYFRRLRSSLHCARDVSLRLSESQPSFSRSSDRTL
ncbi:hypothetical protein HYPSUDRAFT_440352 [Hypholoma sublateritium FD-334 SS-4]|uniref:Uncharacterized protein n=1 Tax=Hypholoma sublateritium (strain FD-334 SS-4) TaxID=945553 RepID=A0A0D2P2L3_HYPSF|nr:hypothetical protein HYPSUDRAFT_440352 [Hypholoma sublateritium FD-334 SS-4]